MLSIESSLQIPDI